MPDSIRKHETADKGVKHAKDAPKSCRALLLQCVNTTTSAAAHLMRRRPVRSTFWCRRVTRLRVASARKMASCFAATYRDASRRRSGLSPGYKQHQGPSHQSICEGQRMPFC